MLRVYACFCPFFFFSSFRPIFSLQPGFRVRVEALLDWVLFPFWWLTRLPSVLIFFFLLFWMLAGQTFPPLAVAKKLFRCLVIGCVRLRSLSHWAAGSLPPHFPIETNRFFSPFNTFPEFAEGFFLLLSLIMSHRFPFYGVPTIVVPVVFFFFF